MVESIVQDVRRSVRARPWQSLLLAGMISLGVAASSSTFAIVDQVLLRPIPGVVDSESLATLGVRTASDRSMMIAIRDAAVLRDAAVVDGLAGYRGAYLSLLQDGYGPIAARGVFVYGDYFDLLGVRPIRGRLLSGADQQPNEIVISEHLWTQSFGASEEIIGMSIRADGESGGGVFTVVGVAAGPFRGSQKFWEVDYWIPLQAMPLVGYPEELFHAADAGILQFLIARPTADRDAVASVLTRTLRETSARAELREAKVGVTSGLANPETAPFYRAAVAVLLGMIGLVFLLPTLNVAGIFSIRLIRDRRNEQVRLALGATASQRLLANAFEGALVGALAGGAGLWASDVLSALYRGQTFILGVPLTGPLRSPLTGIALILIVSLGVAALFTLIGWSARRHAGLQTVSHSGSQSSVRIGRGLPVVAALQLALIVPLLVGGALMLRTLQEMASLQPGFSVDNLYSVDIPLLYPSAPDESGRSAQLSSILTARGATAGATTALMGFGPYENSRPSAQVRVVGSSQPPIASELDWATGDWLTALDVAVVEGSGFSRGVNDGAEAEAIVTRALARELFTGSAIGQRIEISVAQDHTARIVGVIPDLRIRDPRASSAKLVVTSEQVSYLRSSPALLARPVGPARETLVGLQDELGRSLPMLPLGEFRPVSEMARDLIAEQTVLARLLLVIGVAGVGVALTGLYAVMTFVAEVRRREFGIRMALGASPHRTVGHAASSVSRVVVSGMVVGALLTPIMIVGLRSRLVGVAPLDPTAIGASAFILLLVAVAAGLNPARRALSVDPVVELRAD